VLFFSDSAMLIICQNCGTSYQIDPATLGPNGRSVRCARCQNVWFTPNAAAAGAEPVADAAAPPPPESATPPAAARAAGLRQDQPPALPQPAIEAPPQEITVPAERVAPVPAARAVIDMPPTASGALPAGEDIESVASRRARRYAARRRMRWPIPALSTAILALVAINLGLVAWRTEVVRWLPQTASLYEALHLPVNLRGLVFANITSTTEAQNGVPVLVIEGVIASTSARPAEVPRLRFAVRNAGGNEIYSWTALPTRAVLAAGETLAFRSRLASPPRETHDVVVRFFNRRDLLADIR
jgi:predicted Zn finger-like uncharacterized protein